jgi:palmitoyltransferase
MGWEFGHVFSLYLSFYRLSLIWSCSAILFCIFSGGMLFSTTQLIVRNISTIDSLSYKTKVYQLAIHDPNPPSRHHQPLSTHSPNISRVWLPPNPKPGEQQRCFAILKTEPGENPWKLQTIFQNFHESLGTRVWSWFLPWGIDKPGTSGREEGWYRWNPRVIARLRKEAGIQVLYDEKNKR